MIICIYTYRLIGLVGRVFANDPGDMGPIPGRVTPKTFKMVLGTSLLNTLKYKVRSKGRVDSISWIVPRTLCCWVLARRYKVPFFNAFGMTWPGIEPRSPGPLSNTLPTSPLSRSRLKLIYHQIFDAIEYTPCKITRKISVVYGDVYIIQRNVKKWAKYEFTIEY